AVAHLGVGRRRVQPRQSAAELESIGEEPDRFDEPVARFAVALQARQRDGLSEPRLPDAWVHLDDVRVLMYRRVETPPASQRVGQLQTRLEIGGIASHRRRESINREIELTVREKKHPEAVVGWCKI